MKSEYIKKCVHTKMELKYAEKFVRTYNQVLTENMTTAQLIKSTYILQREGLIPSFEYVMGDHQSTKRERLIRIYQCICSNDSMLLIAYWIGACCREFNQQFADIIQFHGEDLYDTD